VRENDQAWIYGFYTCVATNEYGIADINIKLERASEYRIATRDHYVRKLFVYSNCDIILSTVRADLFSVTLQHIG